MSPEALETPMQGGEGGGRMGTAPIEEVGKSASEIGKEVGPISEEVKETNAVAPALGATITSNPVKTADGPIKTPNPPAPVIDRFKENAKNFRYFLILARNKVQARKRKKLEKIMQMFESKPKITNDQVEKLLHISDRTATRYL